MSGDTVTCAQGLQDRPIGIYRGGTAWGTQRCSEQGEDTSPRPQGPICAQGRSTSPVPPLWGGSPDWGCFHVAPLLFPAPHFQAVASPQTPSPLTSLCRLFLAASQPRSASAANPLLLPLPIGLLNCSHGRGRGSDAWQDRAGHPHARSTSS